LRCKPSAGGELSARRDRLIVAGFTGALGALCESEELLVEDVGDHIALAPGP
jgi:hypothetical protein